MSTTTHRSSRQDHGPRTSRSVPTLPAELRPWLWKQRWIVVLLTLFYYPNFLVHGRPLWGQLLNIWGLYPRGTPNDDHVWIHAVGAGEMQVAIALVSALPRDIRVVITGHPQALCFARKVLKERVELTRPPALFGFAVRGFLRRYSPRQLLLIEATDVRPLVCLRLVRRELPTALVNGWFNSHLTEVVRFSSLREGVQIFGVRGEESGVPG